MTRSGTTEASALAAELLGRGFVHVREPLEDKTRAWATAREVFAAAARSDAIGVDMPRPEVVGEFTVPPPGALRRDFQALHIDFGVPVEPDAPADVARFTALYVDLPGPPTSALTRVVPLEALLRQRTWSDPETLLASLRRYGKGCGVGARYVEGILGRLVEAADESAALPSPADPNFAAAWSSHTSNPRAHSSTPQRAARPPATPLLLVPHCGPDEEGSKDRACVLMAAGGGSRRPFATCAAGTAPLNGTRWGAPA